MEGDNLLIAGELLVEEMRPRSLEFYGQVGLFDPVTGERIRTFDDPRVAAPDLTGEDFGTSIAIDGDYVGVGASYQGRTSFGEAHVYDLDTGELLRTFVDPTPITISQSETAFANSVAIDGGKILIGDAGNSDGVGRAYLHDVATGELLRTFDGLAFPKPRGGFGSLVDIDGDRALISSSLVLGWRVHLFDTTTGEWLNTFDDPMPVSGRPDIFDITISIDGDYVVVGEPGDDSFGENVGRAYVFDAVTGELLHTLDHPSPTGGDAFGNAVAIDGDKVLVAAPFDDRTGLVRGAAYLFDAASGSLLEVYDDPTPRNQRPPGVTSSFATSIAIDGDRLLIGDPVDRIGLNRGRAHLFAVIPEPTAATLCIALGLHVAVSDPTKPNRAAA